MLYVEMVKEKVEKFVTTEKTMVKYDIVARDVIDT
jgi:hypothetical protein